MTAAAFAKGLLALEGELTPILVQMVKSANTNGLLDNDCDSSKHQNMAKSRLHELMQQDREFTQEDRERLNPCGALSINTALDFVKNPVRCCEQVHELIQRLVAIVRTKREDPKTRDAILYHGETWELMGRRWGKIEKDFCTKNKTFDISKIPDIYDCIKYDLQHNQHTLQFEQAEELYIYAKYLADIVIPQEYGLNRQNKLMIGQGICTPLLKKIRADLQRNIEEFGEESVNRLNPRYSHGVSSPGRHVRTRLYFTSESHVHSLLTVLRYGGLLDFSVDVMMSQEARDEQWRRAMQYVSMVSELNYMAQVVIMLYEDPTKDPFSEARFHVELHFSPGVNCCVQKNLPPGPGFRPHSRNDSAASKNLGSDGGGSTKEEEEEEDLALDEVMGPMAGQNDSMHDDIEVPEEEEAEVSQPEEIETEGEVDMEDENSRPSSLKASEPIPIKSRPSPPRDVNLATVAREEGAQRSLSLTRGNRNNVDSEPRSRSFDHPRDRTSVREKDESRYQSLDAVNGPGPHSLPCCPLHDAPCLPPAGLRPPLPPLSPRSQAPPPLLHALSSPAISPSPEPCFFWRSLSSPGSPSSMYTPSPPPYLGAGGEMRRAPHLPGLFKLLGKGGTSASSLFSTAVITGGTAVSAPCLLKHDHAVPAACSVAAIEGCGGVPPIRPLETLHNALSLRQLDAFLERMTAAPFRTPPPCASPPKLPGTLPRLPHELQSPSNSVGWSGPPSFVSSSGPSSPNGSASLVDYFTSGDPTAPSSLSASLLSEEGGSGLLNYFSNMLPAQLTAGVFPPTTTTSAGVTPGSSATTPDDLLLERRSSDEEDPAPDLTVTEEPPMWPIEPPKPPNSGSTSPSSGTDQQTTALPTPAETT